MAVCRKKSKSPNHWIFSKEILRPYLSIAAVNYAKVILYIQDFYKLYFFYRNKPTVNNEYMKYEMKAVAQPGGSKGAPASPMELAQLI